ncbi:MAG: hypothetical protein CL581_16045 [Alteromonadaceae bacterium]|nr:hypothetical protein [Alteromonadaceae bacterium]MBH87342.1 hypothetical protein [Alteromonadaceae bacterium]|tara:strand:+ start:28063 stop:29646 length:1584 start_codon:yes stop_codon:yes gene_type:complete
MTLLGRFIRSSAFRTLETLVNIGVGFLMLPFLLHQLGQEMYGIWVLVGSITATFYLFDLGFASAVTRFISAALSRDDRTQAQSVSSTAFVLYLGLALAVTLATFVVALCVPAITDTDENNGLIQILVVITGLTLAVEFPFKAYAGIISYHVRYDLMSASRLVIKLIATATTVTLLLNGQGVITVAVVALLSSLTSNLSFRWFSRRLEPDVDIKLRTFSQKYLKELFSFSAWTFLIDISRLLQDRAAIWAIGFFLSPQVLTIFYVGQRLTDYTFELLYRAVSMYTPILTRDYINDEMDAFRRKVVVFTKLNFVLAVFAFSGFVVLGRELISLWMGGEFPVNLAYEVGIILLAAKLLLFISMPINSAFMAIHQPRIMSIVGIIETLLLVTLLAVLLGPLGYGIKGAAVAVFLSYVATRLLAVPLLISKAIELPLTKIYTSWLRPIATALVCGSLTKWVISITESSTSGILTFALGTLTFGLLVMITLPLLISQQEQKQLKTILPSRWMPLFTWPALLLATRKNKKRPTP